MENIISKCKYCKKGLRDIKDDWQGRGAHKKCWKINQSVEDMINYFKVAKYIPASYKIPSI